MAMPLSTRRIPYLQSPVRARLACALGTLALLSACGGGSNGSGSASTAPAASAAVATGTTVMRVEVPAISTREGANVAVPEFHLAPVILDAPSGIDALDNAGSAGRAATFTPVPDAIRAVSTQRLTLQDIRALAGSMQGVSPMASGGTTTYTPAQIRAAYALPALPAAGTTPTAAQAAQMGAGQTVYIVDANNDPNVAAELSAFNQTFGLPACTTQAIATNASLPLAPAGKTGCVFSVVYSTASGTMTASAPAYDNGWATEIALDVQWVHATAPYARIILIEAPDASNNSLLGAITLANSMGSGMVSMSFGGPEGSWTSSVDSAFTGAGMTYLAATGDGGAGVSWPAVSTHVLAISGTSLTYSGSGARSEVAWSLTGGGISQYTATPSYQVNGAVPGLGTLSGRGVGDAAFNADPNTGQYLAVMTPGSSSVNWLSAGGTSLATPQWAGLLAVANALRAQNGVAALGAPHAILYGQVAAVPGTYAADLADITKGSDGGCGTCTAKVGYDTATGLGTPNATSLLATLAGNSSGTPIVAAATVNGTVGKALSFTVSVSSPDSVTLTMTGAPSGMALSSAGVLSWSKPVAGTYPVVVTAKDSKTGVSGKGTITVVITPPAPPTVTAAAVSGTAGTALSYAVAYTAPDSVTFSLAGAPSGMTISTAGVLAWAAPVVGKYAVTVTAKDATTGLSGQGLVTVTIATQPPPSVAGGTINGSVGTALSFNVAVTSNDPIAYSLTGAPSGMTVSNAGLVSWAVPVAGTYSVVVTAKDTKTGLSGQGTYTVQITTGGPQITAPAMNGVAGKPLTGTIALSDPTATWMSVSISGAPQGMSFSLSGMNIVASWSSPVTGTYALQVVVVDSAGLTAQANVPITITAH